MIIFLYGPDNFRSRQKLNEIIERYKKIHKSGLNLKFFDLGEKETLVFQNFKNEAQAVSMFEEKKLIILKNSSHNKNFEEEFLKNANYFVKSSDIFLFYEEETPKKSKFFYFLKKNGKSQEFQFLEGERLKNWLKKEFKKYKTEIEAKALDTLIEFVGNDLWQMENEIKKLVNYSGRKEIKKKDVEILVKPKIEADIFKTIDAIASKNKKEAFLLIKRHLEKGDSPSYILAMINFQFRNLLIIRDLIERKKPLNLILRELDFHPFLVKKSYFLAKKFKFEELKKIYQKIFEADFKIKTGKILPQAALEFLVAGI